MNFRKMIQLGFVMMFVLAFTFSVMATNDVIVNQSSTTSGPNQALITQTAGNDNKINIDQDATSYNYAKVDQAGASNVVRGTTPTGLPMPASIVVDSTGPAVQFSSTGYNYLLIGQAGTSNQVGLFQSAYTYNDARIAQSVGSNILVAWQKAYVTYNDLDVVQDGSDNANIIQNASTYNMADIWQGSGSNVLTSRQNASTGFNSLTVDQNNSATANVYQNAVAGDNTAVIYQIY